MGKHSYITTYTGVQVNLADPTVDMINITDIAHHLSMVCRWAGATEQFFSVAQHSVLVSYIVPAELAQWGLMHDAAEAYIGDITRPLKNLLPDVRKIEHILMETICEKFNLAYPEPAELCEYDDQMIRFEAETMMKRHDGKFSSRSGESAELPMLSHHQRRQIPIRYFTPMNQPVAEISFAMRFKELWQTAEIHRR